MIGHSLTASESWKSLPWKQFQKTLFRLQQLAQQFELSIVNLATTNIKHISHFAIVEEWQNIAMSL
jgi:hypothetical protein